MVDLRVANTSPIHTNGGSVLLLDELMQTPYSGTPRACFSVLSSDPIHPARRALTMLAQTRAIGAVHGRTKWTVLRHGELGIGPATQTYCGYR